MQRKKSKMHKSKYENFSTYKDCKGKRSSKQNKCGKKDTDCQYCKKIASSCIIYNAKKFEIQKNSKYFKFYTNESLSITSAIIAIIYSL